MLKDFSKENKMLVKNKENVLSYTIITKDNYGVPMGSIRKYITEIIERYNRRIKNE